MKVNKILFFLLVSCLSYSTNYCLAQSLQLIKATRQGYAGGVAGHYGINYTIVAATKSYTVIPDTLWVNGKAYPIDYKTKEGNATRKIDSTKHTVMYTITVTEAHNQFHRPPMEGGSQGNDTTLKKTGQIRQFDGAAMISYMVKHKQRFFIIKSFTLLEQINYP